MSFQFLWPTRYNFFSHTNKHHGTTVVLFPVRLDFPPSSFPHPFALFPSNGREWEEGRNAAFFLVDAAAGGHKVVL